MARVKPIADGAVRRAGTTRMALYYFHLCDGVDTLIDPDGRDVADVAQIAAMAMKDARAIIGDDAARGSIKLDQHIEVLDEAGR